MNKIKYSLLLIFACYFGLLTAQNSDTVFYEHFSNNDNHWTLKDTTLYTTKIENHHYIFTFRGENNYSFWNWIKIDYSKNFVIEMDTKWVDGSSNNGYGITLGFRDWDNYLEFNISANGYYYVRWRYQGIDNGNGWKQSGAINDSAGNKLKIVKYNNYLAFYINNRFVEKIPYEKIIVRNFGLIVNDRQTISFGDILIKYLDKNDLLTLFGNTETERLQSIENSHKILKNKSDTNYWFTNKKTIIFDEKFNNNNNLWYEQNSRDTVIRKITDGAYAFENFTDSRMITYQTIFLLRNYDYTIQCKTKWIKGTSDFGYGLMWSSKDMKNNNEFVIVADGAYRISAYNKDNSQPAQWVKDSIINKKGENILKISRNNDSLYLYINHKLIATFEDILMCGNDIGFIVDNKQKVLFYDFLVTEDLPEYKIISNQKILSDNFKSGSENWEIGKNEYSSASVKDNDYVIEHYDTSYGHARVKEININDNNNFTISTHVKYLKSGKNQSYGIIYGHKDWGNDYQFLINSDGLFKCIHSVNGKPVSTGWKKCDNFKPDDFNKLSIFKKGDRVEYYLNDKLLEIMPFFKLFGNITGFVIYGRQTIAISDFTISEDYTDLPQFEKANIIKEYHFSDNKKEEWDFKGSKEDGSYVERFKKNGSYVINFKGKKNSDKVFNDQINIPYGIPETKTILHGNDYIAKKDFKIELTLQFLNADSDFVAGITFEDKSFLIRKNGSFNINKSKEWQNSNVISKTSILRLAIEMCNNELKYFLNDFIIETSTAVFKKANYIPERNIKFEMFTKGNKMQTVAINDFVIKHY